MAEFVEKVFRSRQTLLGILRDRGYDTTGADKVGPEEIRAALAATPSGKVLEFTLKAVDGAKVPTPYMRVYIMLYVIKHKLQSFLTMLEPTPEGVEEGTQFKDKIGAPADPEKTSVVCLINELDNENKIPEVFYQASVTAWAKNKLRLSFFNMDSFTFDPRKHFMVPKHEIVPPEEHEGLLNSLYVASKKQLPYITYSDMQCRVLGAVPGDILKITRPSPSSGEYVVYRTVVP